jgi:hypothetical protein
VIYSSEVYKVYAAVSFNYYAKAGEGLPGNFCMSPRGKKKKGK